MKIIYKQIDDLMIELNNEISNLTIDKEQVNTELTNIQSEYKELEMQIEDMQKIINSYSMGSNNTHAVFSPIENDKKDEEFVKHKIEEQKEYQNRYEVVAEKLAGKKAEYDKLMEAIDKCVSLLVTVENIKNATKKQVDTYNNEAYIRELKDIQQKKRMIQMEHTKCYPMVSKIESQCITPAKDILNQMQLVLNFIQTEPLRAKQELQQVYDKLSDTIVNTEKYMNKISTVDNLDSLSKAVKEYIDDIVVIYQHIKFKIYAYNLKPIDNLNSDLNRCLMTLFRGLINSFILKTSPKEIQLRFSYEEGYLNVTGVVIGNYVNFYNEMKKSPSSIIANMYEKVFLLHGDMVFKNNENGSFNVNISIPIKNYLV